MHRPSRVDVPAQCARCELGHILAADEKPSMNEWMHACMQAVACSAAKAGNRQSGSGIATSTHFHAGYMFEGNEWRPFEQKARCRQRREGRCAHAPRCMQPGADLGRLRRHGQRGREVPMQRCMCCKAGVQRDGRHARAEDSEEAYGLTCITRACHTTAGDHHGARTQMNTRPHPCHMQSGLICARGFMPS